MCIDTIGKGTEQAKNEANQSERAQMMAAYGGGLRSFHTEDGLIQPFDSSTKPARPRTTLVDASYDGMMMAVVAAKTYGEDVLPEVLWDAFDAWGDSMSDELIDQSWNDPKALVKAFLRYFAINANKDAEQLKAAAARAKAETNKRVDSENELRRVERALEERQRRLNAIAALA